MIESGIGPRSVWLPPGVAPLGCELVKESLSVTVALTCPRNMTFPFPSLFPLSYIHSLSYVF